MRFLRSELLGLALLGSVLLLRPLCAQTDNPDTNDVWEDIELTEPVLAPGPGGFGIYGGPIFEYSTLKTTDLDPDLDHTLLLTGGSGYVIIANWLVGCAGAGVTLNNPNDRYDRFRLGYGGFITGYDRYLFKDLSGRVLMLVGGGDLEMVKKINIPNHEGEFLERFRKEDFFLTKGEVSIGYNVLPFTDIRAAASYWYPIGGENAEDLRGWTFGLRLMLGFRNNVF
ncbi:MAG: hypothetical protein J4G05_06760 [Chlorobi bacterium]|nr:hypothetical protein [Chlorobiota bacterium]